MRQRAMNRIMDDACRNCYDKLRHKELLRNRL